MPFLPTNLQLLYYLLATDMILIVGGYFIVKNRLVFTGWLLFAFTLVIVAQICVNENAVFRMLAIISSMFICMKIVAGAESYKKTKIYLTKIQWLAFAIGWAGMRAQLFETLGGKPITGSTKMIWYGTTRLCMGIIILLLARQLLPLNINKEFLFFTVTAFLLAGYSLILHFGILSISAGIWRWFGVKTYLLFKSPLLSASLSEFWSKRWNIAFSEMISIAIYRPLKSKIGAPLMIVVCFIFSGFLHEMAISLPVGKGFGLPSLYFIIQAIAILLEKFLSKQNSVFLKNKIFARAWVYFWVIVPAPILFHIYFIKGIVWPIMGFPTP